MLRLAKAVPAALVGLALNASAQGFDEVASFASPCPGAHAWYQAHPELAFDAMQRRDAARTLTDPALAAELKARFQRDQKARRAWLADRSQRKLQREVDTIDRDDIRWLYDLVTTKAMPTAAQVGELGVHNTWLLAQHADDAPKFQAELLAAFEARHAAGELSGNDLARYTDRVLKAQDKPQRYGTQFTPKEMAMTYFGLSSAEEVRRVDDNRRALGVMPLADYACMMSYLRRDQQ